jgi:hypothetical protein
MTRIINALFTLTNNMCIQMSDKHNAGNYFIPFCLLFIDSCTKCAVVPFPSPYNMITVKPFRDTSLCQFMDKKLQGSKGKHVQERLEVSIVAFDAIFLNYNEYNNWIKSGNRPTVRTMLENMYKSVQQYYNR